MKIKIYFVSKPEIGAIFERLTSRGPRQDGKRDGLDFVVNL